MTQNKFPTEIIDLPSKGHFYPEDNPLSSGKIEMRYMTARDEDILTSANLIQQGKALDKLLQSLIVDKKIDYNDILVGDKNAVLVGARVLAYGKNYDFSFVDGYGEQVKGIADLTKLTLPEFRDAMVKTLADPNTGIAGATEQLSQTSPTPSPSESA